MGEAMTIKISNKEALNELRKYQDNLTDWEHQFMGGVATLIDADKGLSAKQQDVFDKLFNRLFVKGK